METGAMPLGGGGVGGVGLATTVLGRFYGRFFMQTLAQRASVTVQKLYVISALRTTLATTVSASDQADS
ncbi:MAG: hypothetical protein ACREEA_00910 [Stellaceae bacterium]